jgi:hypothetical protein
MGDVLYHHMMLCVTALSVAVHTSRHVYLPDPPPSKYIEILSTVDKIAAHLAFCIVFKDMLGLILYGNIYNSWMLFFPYTILMTWFLEHCPQYQDMEKYLHAILHLASISAVHIVMVAKHK